MTKKFPWLSMRKKTDPELPLTPPIWFGNQSNGEYFRPASERDRKVERMILERADENARRLGLDRREFLASAMGMCTTLMVMAETGCSSDGGSGGSGGSKYVGSLKCPMPQTQYDESAACEALAGDPNEFIFDVQTHWFDPRTAQPSYVRLFKALFEAGTLDNYVRYMFCESDTHVTAITSWPGNPCHPSVSADECGLPLSNESMVESRNIINQRALNTRRSVNHVQVMGQSALGVDSELETMERVCANGGASAWKLYPGFLAGFKMDDPKVGRRIIEKGLQLGVNQFCVHKGLQIVGFNKETNYPDDIGVVADAYPEANFVIYHSAINAGYQNNDAPPEGPYDPGPGVIGRPYGVNALIKALADKGIGPDPGQRKNTNVYGEVGSAINHVMNSNDPLAPAHFFGKLMKYLGTDYVVWGTDCIVYGSPQKFIEWFRNVTIPVELQEKYGYPALDDTAEGKRNRAKIFGLNAARLYGIDVEETRCQVNMCATAKLKQRMDEEIGPRRWVFDEPYGPRTYAEYVENARELKATGRPG